MDFKIIGIGIAVTFAIIAFSAITLYLTFRIKETFREEKGMKIQAAKTCLLLGVLFLAGSMFYFFAQALYQPEKSSNNTGALVPFEPWVPVKNASIGIDLSYPDSVKADGTYAISFRIYNPTPRTVHDATIRLVGLSPFEVKSNFNVDSSVLSLGDVLPGERSGYLQLKAPSQPTKLDGELILQSKESDPLTKDIKITVHENNILSSNTPGSPSVPVPTPVLTAASSQREPPVYIIWNEPPTSTPPAPVSTPAQTPAQTPNSTSTPEQTPNSTPAPTPDLTSTPMPTLTSSPTPSSTPTSTPTPDPTSTPIPTLSPTPTPSPTSSPTPTPAPTPTSTPTPTFPPTPTPTPTPDPAPTSTPTPEPTPEPTPNLTPEPTPNPTPTPALTPDPVPSPVPTPDPAPSPVPTP